MKKKSIQDFKKILLYFILLLNFYAILNIVKNEGCYNFGVGPKINASGAQIFPKETVQDELVLNEGENLTNQGKVKNNDYKIFWFIQITDTQSIWMEWGGDERRDPEDGSIKNVKYFFNETQNTIKPVFIVNTGDLVDSDYHNFFLRNRGQLLDEWSYYNETITERGMNSTFYFDIPGNHDVYRDPLCAYYLNYSMSGSFFGTDQFLVNINFTWGNYSFYFLSTPEDYGLEYPFALGGKFGKNEINWFQNKLVANANNNLSFAFGHHPPLEIISCRASTGQNFINLLRDYQIKAYFCGHGHMETYQDIYGVAAVETGKFSHDWGTYRIVAVDEDRVSTVQQIGQHWPVGIITNPIDEKFAIGKYDMQKHMNPQKIRALAWDPLGVTSVEWRSDRNPTWTLMNEIIGDPLWEADFDNSLIDGKKHLIEIRINGGSGTKIESIIYSASMIYHFGWTQGIYIITSLFIGLVVVLPMIKYFLSHKGFKGTRKFIKKKEDEADKIQTKLVLIKFLFVLILPIALPPIYNETIIVMFPFFMISSAGIIINDVPMLLTAIIGVPSIGFQVLNLSKRKAKWMSLTAYLSMLITILLAAFFILHFGLLGAILPSYYVVFLLDYKILKRSKQMRNPLSTFEYLKAKMQRKNI